MSDPTPAEPGQDDLTADDHLVEQTGNGPAQGDPEVQPSQAPDDLPAGTVTDHPEVVTPEATEHQEAYVDPDPLGVHGAAS